MSKTRKMSIDVAKVLAPIISSRDVASSLKKAIYKTSIKDIDLDFTNVEFVSRSAAHELLLLKDKCSKAIFRSKRINFIKTRSDVTNMFRAVAASRVMPIAKDNKERIESISLSELSRFAF